MRWGVKKGKNLTCKPIFYVKNHPNLSHFYTNLGAHFLSLTFFCWSQFEKKLLLKWSLIFDSSPLYQFSKFNNFLWWSQKGKLKIDSTTIGPFLTLFKWIYVLNDLFIWMNFFSRYYAFWKHPWKYLRMNLAKRGRKLPNQSTPMYLVYITMSWV